MYIAHYLRSDASSSSNVCARVRERVMFRVQLAQEPADSCRAGAPRQRCIGSAECNGETGVRGDLPSMTRKKLRRNKDAEWNEDPEAKVRALRWCCRAGTAGTCTELASL